MMSVLGEISRILREESSRGEPAEGKRYVELLWRLLRQQRHIEYPEFLSYRDILSSAITELRYLVLPDKYSWRRGFNSQDVRLLLSILHDYVHHMEKVHWDKTQTSSNEDREKVERELAWVYLYIADCYLALKLPSYFLPTVCLDFLWPTELYLPAGVDFRLQNTWDVS